MSRQLLFVLLLVLAGRVRGKGIRWKVAVYEHEVFTQESAKQVLSREVAIGIVRKNIEVFTEQARTAAAQLAKMIVFPENGLYGNRLTRDSIAPYLEDVPSPNLTSSCPCKSSSVNTTEVYAQYRLSCMARFNGIYVVATLGDRKPCELGDACPDDGHWQFNTAVVYDPEGCLVARYHKQNLVDEEAFDSPAEAQLVTFETPYGKFGVGACLDILFKRPMVELVTRHGVESLVFPTAWKDALPLLSAIGFHTAWAVGMKVNLLAANQYRPAIRMSGSGVYSPQGALDYTCRNPQESGRLVVADLPPAGTVLAPVSPTPLNMSLGELIRRVEAPHFTFKAWLFHDHFKFIWMRAKTGLKKVCEHNFCCYLRYEMESYDEDELYAFGAFWGKHTFEGDYFIQTCAFVRCRLGDLHTTCGSPVSVASTKFRSFYIDGTFNSTYVFPIVLTANYTLPEPDEVQFGKYPFPFMESKGVSKPVVVAGLMARLYDKDAAGVVRASWLGVFTAVVTAVGLRQ